MTATTTHVKAPLSCRRIMRAFVASVREDESIMQAARMMREHDVGFLPVCHADGKVLGVITDRDVTLRVAAEDQRASLVLVRDVMTTAVVACALDDLLSKVLRRMSRHRITRIVVLDDQGRAAGVLSLSDIAQYASSSLVGRTLRTIAERKYLPQRP